MVSLVGSVWSPSFISARSAPVREGSEDPLALAATSEAALVLTMNSLRFM